MRNLHRSDGKEDIPGSGSLPTGKTTELGQISASHNEPHTE